MKGLYFHIPFCRSKCPYCDFYSMRYDEKYAEKYLYAVLDEIKTLRRTGEFVNRDDLVFDTVYFGGGTPSVFGAEKIGAILNCARQYFSVSTDAEITVECNPSTVDDEFFYKIASFGVNRVSLGMQSAVDDERRILGRFADSKAVMSSVNGAKKSGITNISLDLMLGVPGQTIDSLDKSLDFLLKTDVRHISAYMLTLEEGTHFYKNQNKFVFPDEDAVCEMYLKTSQTLKNSGFCHYEISNFAEPGFESRHNLKYWDSEEYLGIGASAHSFTGGKRFFFARSVDDFTAGEKAQFDSSGGDFREYIMLKLRLARGIDFSEYFKRFGKVFPEDVIKKARIYEKNGLVNITENGISLTTNGFLLSNSIISELI